MCIDWDNKNKKNAQLVIVRILLELPQIHYTQIKLCWEIPDVCKKTKINTHRIADVSKRARNDME